MKDELFPLVLADGTVTGCATRAECHSGSKLLHPVVHLHVFSSDGKILLQKRALNKDIQPGKWDTSVGGHVDYGEEITDALRREAAEELGLANFTPTALNPYVFESDIERELINPFTTTIDSNVDLKYQTSEISEIRFWDIKEVRQHIGTGILTPNFEQEFIRFFNGF